MLLAPLHRAEHIPSGGAPGRRFLETQGRPTASCPEDPGELVVEVAGGVEESQDPLERDRGGDAAFARHLAEDLQDLLTAEDFPLVLQLAFQVLASAHCLLKIDFVRVCGEPGRSCRRRPQARRPSPSPITLNPRRALTEVDMDAFSVILLIVTGVGLTTFLFLLESWPNNGLASLPPAGDAAWAMSQENVEIVKRANAALNAP